MSKPAPTTELDDAKRVLGVLGCVSDPKEYMEIFGLTKKDIERYEELVKNNLKASKKNFIEI